MWKASLTLTLFSLSALAQAKDTAPTAENWQDLSPAHCQQDPRDNLNLTPLIFPPEFNTTMKPYEPDIYPTEVIITPNRKRNNGQRLPVFMGERTIPNMAPMRTDRYFEYQYLGFLDTDGRLVDETGRPISDDNPLTLQTLDDLPESKMLWDRIIEKKDTALTDFKGVSPVCQYHIDPSVMEARLQRWRRYQRIPSYICKEGGGYTLAPIETLDELRRKMIKTREARVTIWDHKGRRYSGSAEELAPRFIRLDESEKCDWTKAEID